MIKDIKLGHVSFDLDESTGGYPLRVVIQGEHLAKLRAFLGVDSLDPEEAELIRKHRADKAAREAATKRYARIKELEAELAKLRAEEQPQKRKGTPRCLACGNGDCHCDPRDGRNGNYFGQYNG